VGKDAVRELTKGGKAEGGKGGKAGKPVSR
jgi:hypothetical protein